MAPPLWKPSTTERKKLRHANRRDLKADEERHKREAKKRDGYKCRFPLCGCRKLALPLEVSHLKHKGMGGDPSGDRSHANGLITLCVHRHQDGAVSIHHGTLRVQPTTPKGADGPCAFLVDRGLIWPELRRDRWYEVARERSVGVLDTLTPVQKAVLLNMADLQV